MFKNRLGLLLVLCGFAQVCFTQGAASPVNVVPITKEPAHHLVFENEYVRVFKVEVAPHAETLYHKHDVDYVFVTLGDSDVESVRVGEQPVRLQLKDGETRFTKGGFAHKAVNKSDKPFVNVTVELKRATRDDEVYCGVGYKKLCEGAGGGVGGRSDRSDWYNYVLQSKKLTIAQVVVEGTDSMLDFCGRGNRLLIFVSGGPFGFALSGNPSVKPGELRWMSSAERPCEAWTKGRFEYVALEFHSSAQPRAAVPHDPK